jgi:hypothetical protein
MLEPNREIWGFFKGEKKIQKLEIIIIIINLAILKEIHQLAKISQKKTSSIGPYQMLRANFFDLFWKLVAH